MRTMTWAAAAALLLAAAAAGPVSAQTWYKPAPASGVATGNLTFYTNLGPVSCAASVPWRLTGGYVQLGGFNLTGNFCNTIIVSPNLNMMTAAPSPTSTYNAGFNIVWNWSGSPPCVSNPGGLFINATSSITVYGSMPCTIGGTLTFPGLQLLP